MVTDRTDPGYLATLEVLATEERLIARRVAAQAAGLPVPPAELREVRPAGSRFSRFVWVELPAAV